MQVAPQSLQQRRHILFIFYLISEQKKQKVSLELVVMLIREMEAWMAFLEEIDQIQCLDGFLQLLERLGFCFKSLSEQSQGYSHQDHMSVVLILG